MSKQLAEMMSQLIRKEGASGKAKLSLAIDRGERMIDRYIKGTSTPSYKHAYKLALACGCTAEEASELADASSEARETA